MKTDLTAEQKRLAKTIAAACHPDYKGRKFRVEARATYQMSDYWSEGTRNFVVAYDIETGEISQPAIPAGIPMNQAAHAVVTIPPGVLLVERAVFCGRECGVSIYFNPLDRQALPPGLLALVALTSLAVKRK